jgi:multiple sugar transport system permease protein
MSSAQQVLPLETPRRAGRAGRPRWRFRLQGSDTAWAIAFVVPYAAVFLAFIAYPVVFGLWLGSRPALYTLLLSDPRYIDTLVNTLLFVGIGVNVKIFLAFLISGFFVQRRGWWRQALLVVFLLPWAVPALSAFLSMHYMLVSQWGLLDSLWSAVTGTDGPLFLVSRSTAMASNIVAYIWKWLPFWTLIFLSARLAIPREIYEAAAIDGASGIQQTVHVTFPLMANVYLVATLLSTVWTLGDFSTVYFVSSGAPARTTDVLATYGFHQAFTFGHPELGAAAMMSALPLAIPVVILLIRRLHRSGVQL